VVDAHPGGARARIGLWDAAVEAQSGGAEAMQGRVCLQKTCRPRAGGLRAHNGPPAERETKVELDRVVERDAFDARLRALKEG